MSIMSFGQVQLVKWSLPAFALIFGLLWYKRRRVDQVDPGGASKLKGDTVVVDSPNSSKLSSGNHCDSGFSTEESNCSLNTSRSSVEEEISPRKISESLDIPNRKSSSQSLSMISCQSMEVKNTPWYDDEDVEPDVKEIQLGSNPTNSGFDYMNKSKSAEFKNSKSSSIMENVIKEEAKLVVAETELNGHATSEAHFESSCEKSVTGDSQSSGNEKKQRQALSERDSANQSPVSGVLEGSVTDEASSEGSADSGKGGSIKEHRKITTTIYVFEISAKLVGRLIGRSGRFLKYIRNNASVDVIVKRHLIDDSLKAVILEGKPEDIAVALDIIRQHFPEKTYPQLCLDEIEYNVPLDMPSWVPEISQISLVEGVNNDVLICHIMKPNHLFIQLPTHPTYPSLRVLDEKMTHLYDAVESPPVPDELHRGMILVAKWYNKWVRVYVENPDPNGEQTVVRMVDHGGYWTFSHAEMRKIRSDYLTLPFQAIEVFVANIDAKGGEWDPEAYKIVAQICSGVVGQAQIVGYVDSSIYINLYFNIHKHGVISLADELIARGMADPITFEDVIPQEELPPSECFEV